MAFKELLVLSFLDIFTLESCGEIEDGTNLSLGYNSLIPLV